MKQVKLFLLPFAGGNKFSYRQYGELLPEFIESIPLEYPGRGARSQEPLSTDIEFVVTDLLRQLQMHGLTENYAIYGHSMGGLLACLLARKIRACGLPSPQHLFITGTSGPSAESRSEGRHLLSKNAFMEELKSLEGCPPEILAHDELIDYFEPILRADFKISETYVYQEELALDIPITVITGSREAMNANDIALWQLESAQRVDFKTLPGGHFFIYHYPFEIIQIISKKLFSQIQKCCYE